mgnify:CR=1 FL=1
MKFSYIVILVITFFVSGSLAIAQTSSGTQEYGDGGAYGTQNSAHSNRRGTCHQSYDGITWSRTVDSSVTRFYAGISGNAQNAMMIGGRSPSDSDTSVNTVEVFHDAFISGSYLLTKKIGSNLGFSGSQYG